MDILLELLNLKYNIELLMNVLFFLHETLEDELNAYY